MEDQRLVNFCEFSEVLVLYLSPSFRQSFNALMPPILGMRASSLVRAEREKKPKINKIMTKLIQIIPFRKIYVMRILRYLLKKQDACYTGITRDAGADSFIPTVCFAD